MYIEIYLVDNFLMDLLVINVAGVVLGTRASHRKYVMCALGAVYALAEFFLPFLSHFVFKLAVCAILAHSFSAKKICAYIFSFFAVLLSAFITCGLTYAIAFISSGAVENGALYAPISTRVLIISGLLATVLPSAIRRLRRQRVKFSTRHVLSFCANGRQYEFIAVADTGSTLADPISAKPVAIVYAPELVNMGNAVIPFRGAFSTGCLNAFCPDNATVDGIAAAFMVAAQAYDPDMPAILPAAAMPDTFL